MTGHPAGQIVVASIQNNIGYVIAVILIVGFIVAVAANMRRGRHEVGSEIVLAPNRKLDLDDDQLETKRLDRTLMLAMATLAVIGLALPLYWLAEPGRQADAVQGFDATFVKRGEDIYTNVAQCASCHGPNGVGGAKDFTLLNSNGDFVSSVSWKAPALNDVLFRYSRADVKYIIDYGRGFSPMPAWGAAGGGPLSEQQIDNVIDYLQSIQLSADDANAALDKQIATVCAPGDTLPDGNAPCTAPGAEFPTLGETLFNLGYEDGFAGGAYSCGRCHTRGWSYGEAQVAGGGAFGPNLTGGSVLRQFETAQQQIDFVALGAVVGKSYGRSGMGSAGSMPGFGINPNKDVLNLPGPQAQAMSPAQTMYTIDQIAAIVAYERGL